MRRGLASIGAVGLGTAALTLVVLLALPGSSEPSATAPPPGFSADLAAHGISFVPLEEAAGEAVSVPVSAAIEVAVAGYGVDPARVAEVFLGSLTQENRLVEASGGATTSTVPAPAIDRPAYAVRITGLQLLPLGGPATPERAHGELIVFVDAATGDEIFSTTFR